MSEKPDNSNNKPVNLRPIYFQPGQLIFQTHGNLNDTPDLAQKLITWANELAPSGIIISDPDEILNFNPVEKPGSKNQSSHYEKRENTLKMLAEQTKGHYKPPPLKNHPPFSLVLAKVEGENWPDPPSLDSEHTEEDEEAEIQANALNELLDLAIFLDERRDKAPITLEVVSPNWLISGGSSDPGGTGGPGDRPSPVDNSDANNYHITTNLDQLSELPGFFKGVSQPDTGNDVVVAILDTSYSKNELEDIHKIWVLDKPEEEQHPIIKALLSNDPLHPGALREANGQLRVHTDPTVDNYLPGLTIDGHDYDMTDHGLFVAGIINSLAPKAEIHLYQVLNKYGLGDLRSIARALQQVFNDFQEIKLVVNLSLTMNMPLEEGHLKANDVLGVGRKILERKTSIERQSMIFEWICDLVYTLDSRVIAAAGNESKGSDQRPGALYPAAFDRVLGVGALAYADGSVAPASYSNLADKPTNDGITTFGGEAKEKGILGVYVGEFPKDDGGNVPKNTNGWTWWSGTSFATPIISGITTAVLSKLPGAITEEAIIKLFEAQTKTTGDNEDVLTVAQGPQ
ncbi:MAG: S8/S53 family peptidase [Anaerolineales bacterium]